MERIRIYRLENNHNLGPFVGGSSFLFLHLKHKTNTNDKHPIPEDDGLFHCLIKNYHFGCSSFETLKEWFYHDKEWNQEFKELLIKEKYLIKVYETDDNYCIGKKWNQVAFDRNSARLIETHPVDFLLN
jgi:hypothetical protein